MTNEELVKVAPSVASKMVADNASGIYRQMQTLDVVDLMRTQGWNPVKAKQTNCRHANRKETCRHEIRFQRQGDTSLSKVGDESLQAILVNSHDCSTSFTFRLGVFRLACTNGLVVPREVFGEERIRHVGFRPDMVGEVTQKLAEHGQKVAANIDGMKAIDLSEDEQGAFAIAASKLLFTEEAMEENKVKFNPLQLLARRRGADEGSNLWKVFNRVQENAIKGGIRYTARNNKDIWRRASTRAVNNIDRDIKLNQALWTLANEMAKIKVA